MDPENIKFYSEDDINPWRPVCLVSLSLSVGYKVGTAIFGYRQQFDWDWDYTTIVPDIDLSGIDYIDWYTFGYGVDEGKWAYIPQNERL
jgi:hypothetical protein